MRLCTVWTLEFSPALKFGAMVPNSSVGGGWPEQWHYQRYCNDPSDPSAAMHYCVSMCVCVWHHGLCLSDIAALCSSLIMEKTKDIVLATTKRISFSRLMKPLFHHISQLPGDACDHWTKRAGPETVGKKLWGVGRSRTSFHVRMVSVQRVLFYWSKTLLASLLFVLWDWDLSCRGVQNQKQQMFPVRQPWLCKALGALLYPISASAFINTVGICYLLQQHSLNWTKYMR